MGCQPNQRLIRSGRHRESFKGGVAGADEVASLPVETGPGELPICASKYTSASGKPAIVRFQPGVGGRNVFRVKAEVGREALNKETFLMKHVAWFG